MVLAYLIQKGDNGMGKIKDFLGNEWTFDCLGCAIANRKIEIPGGVIYNGKAVFLGADPEVPIPGFLIISSKRHVTSFSQFTKEERFEIGEVLFYAEKALKDLKLTDELTIVQEERSGHFHIWVFPKYDWMVEKFGQGISYLRAISKYAKEHVTDAEKENVVKIAEDVRRYFADCPILE